MGETGKNACAVQSHEPKFPKPNSTFFKTFYLKSGENSLINSALLLTVLFSCRNGGCGCKCLESTSGLKDLATPP